MCYALAETTQETRQPHNVITTRNIDISRTNKPKMRKCQIKTPVIAR